MLASGSPELSMAMPSPEAAAVAATANSIGNTPGASPGFPALGCGASPPPTTSTLICPARAISRSGTALPRLQRPGRVRPTTIWVTLRSRAHASTASTTSSPCRVRVSPPSRAAMRIASSTRSFSASLRA